MVTFIGALLEKGTILFIFILNMNCNALIQLFEQLIKIIKKYRHSVNYNKYNQWNRFDDNVKSLKDI